MALRAEYDHESDAMYVRASDDRVARTVEHGHAVAIDLSDDGALVGVEILGPGTNLDQLPAAVERVGFLERLGELTAAARSALGATTYAAVGATLVTVVQAAPQTAGAESTTISTGSFSSIDNQLGTREVDAPAIPA